MTIYNCKRDWPKFERLVENHLRKKYWGSNVEVKPDEDGSIPDFRVGPIWLFWDDVADAKCKKRITRSDIDKLIRDMETHEATGGQLYISTNAEISDWLLEHAGENEIRVFRLGWNGHFIEELYPEEN